MRRESVNDAERAVRSHLAETRAGLLRTVAACADRAADGWDRAPTDGRAVADALGDELAAAGVLERCPGVLEDAAAAAGHQLAADPVPAPPYVTVTGLGPVLRAPLPRGRLVVTVEAFAVERGGPSEPPRYVRRDADPTGSVTVSFRSR